MRCWFVLALVFGAALSSMVSVVAAEQSVEPLAAGEQQIEVLATGDDMQRVEVINGTAEQVVGEHVPPTPTEKAASKAGKFMLGVASAGVALGVMAASLLLI